MTAVGVIPARYAASRFPGKPLALISGVSPDAVSAGLCALRGVAGRLELVE